MTAGTPDCVRRWRRTEFAYWDCTNWIRRRLRFVEEYCEKELDPLLTPVTVDPAHPFPASSIKRCVWVFCCAAAGARR